MPEYSLFNFFAKWSPGWDNKCCKRTLLY